MENNPKATDPLFDKEFREGRSLYLEDWATLVHPYGEAAHKMVAHSVTYGSTALQAAYIINGGALAALPPLLTSLTKASAASIATAAIPFIVGIGAAAISSLSAYLNFQWAAAIAWHDAELVGARLRKFYQKTADEEPAAAKRERFQKLMECSSYIGVASAIGSLACFVWGAWQFIDLARSTAH